MGPGFFNNSNFAVPWSLEDPIQTPRGLKNPDEAVGMLRAAFEETTEKYGAADRPFGEVSRFHLGELNLSRKQLRTLWRTRTEIESHLEEKYQY